MESLDRLPDANPAGVAATNTGPRSLIESTQEYAPRPSRSDNQLVRECLNGNEEAWSELIHKYKNLIFSISIKYGFGSEDADEIFQEVCLALLTQLPKLRQPQALAAWLIQATSHRCFHWKRKQRRYATTEPNEALSPVPVPEAILREAEREQMVRDALSELPPRCLELVGMLFFQEPPIPYKEVAKNLTVAKDSIGFIRMRCLKRLRQLLVKKGFQ
jgi:RNA polymerase sigma factor (sigma-70 family)